MWKGGKDHCSNESSCFFYLTLKSKDVDAIQSMFSRLRAEAKILLNEAIQLAWFMRGSIQYKEFLDMTPLERDLVKDFISNHMEKIKDHPYPQY